MNQIQLQSSAMMTRYWVYLPVFFLFFLSLTTTSAQEVFNCPRFDANEIKGASGAKLTFILNDLPDPKVYGDAKGNLEIQINWTLSSQCGSTGIQQSETVKIKGTTHKFVTDYILTEQDDRKKLRLNVSYLKPTKNEESPAKGYLAASKECVTLHVH